MSHRSLGCVTFSALISVIITLIVITGLWLIGGGKMFSSGQLNSQTGPKTLGGVKSHAETSGKCAMCHVSPFVKGSMDERCQVCHFDITAQLSDPHSLHGIVTSGKVRFSCRDCHIDHRGPKASLTVMIVTNFPHEKLGYSLLVHKKKPDGSDINCVDCHPSNLSAFDIHICEACHHGLDAGYMTAHVSAFGTSCLDCHDGVDSYGKNFNHGSVTYPLLGKHVNVDCAGCHNGARSIADLKATPQDCYSCHAANDPHSGQFGTSCGGCHTPSGWIPATIDHSLTRFPLVGAHIHVPCQNCHINNQFAGTPTDCFSCHAKDDTHNRQFGTDCSLCHNPIAWNQVTFDHSLSGFPLTGAHLQLKCTQCHVNGQFKGTPTDCAACHPEPAFHLGLFGVDCAACHTTSAWTPAVFNGAHSFPISHGGAGICRDCHPDKLSSWTCYAGCHAHNQGEISSKHQEAGISNFSDCLSCHPTGAGGG